MEHAVSTVLLITSGVLGMVIACIHGWLGEKRVVAPAAHPSRAAKRVMHAIMFLSAVYWFIGGAALTLAPLMDASQKGLIIWIVSAMYTSGAAANFWATRGRHFGWMLLTLATGLAIVGGLVS